MNNQKIVVIGQGFSAPGGTGIAHFQRAWLEPEMSPPSAPHETYDPHGYLGKVGLKFIGKSTVMYCNLAYQCLESAGIAANTYTESQNIGLYDGSELANLEEAWLFDLSAKVEGADYVSPMKAPNTLANASASFMGLKSKMFGANVSVTGGSAGFLQALDIATLHLQFGLVDYAVVAASDVVSRYHQIVFRGMQSATLLDSSSIGVGLTLASEQMAQAIDAQPLCEILALVSAQAIQQETSLDVLERLLKELSVFSRFEDVFLAGSGIADFPASNASFPGFEGYNFHYPESQIGHADSASGGIAFLAAMLQNSNQPRAVIAIDQIGYGVAVLIS